MRIKLVCVLVVLAFCVGTALAQNGNPCPGDKEYQFNIIGMDKAKKVDMDNNDGHRIFVNLNGTSRIYMTGDTDQNSANGLQCGNSFDVLDANATGNGGEATILVPCDKLTATHLNPSVCFDVYATPLGTPGGSTDVYVVCEFDDTCIGCNIDAGDCATGNIDFSLEGHSGKPKTTEISQFFRASGCIDLDAPGTIGYGTCDSGDISFNNEWIFNIEQLEYYYWDYDNHGNRIVQIRFCDVEGVEGSDCGPNTLL